MEIGIIKRKMWPMVVKYVVGFLLYWGILMSISIVYGEDLQNVLVQARESENRALIVFNQWSDKEDKAMLVIRTSKYAIDREVQNLAELTNKTRELDKTVQGLNKKIEDLSTQMIPITQKRRGYENDLDTINKNLSGLRQTASVCTRSEQESKNRYDSVLKSLNETKNASRIIGGMLVQAAQKSQESEANVNHLSQNLVETTKIFAIKSNLLSELIAKEEAAKRDASRSVMDETGDTSKMSESELRLYLQEMTKKQQDMQEKREKSVQTTMEARIRMAKEVTNMKADKEQLATRLTNLKDMIDALAIEKQELKSKLLQVKEKTEIFEPQVAEANKVYMVCIEKTKDANAAVDKEASKIAGVQNKIDEYTRILTKLDKQKNDALSCQKKTQDFGQNTTVNVVRLIGIIDQLQAKKSEQETTYKEVRHKLVEIEKYYRERRVLRIKAEVELKVDQATNQTMSQIISLAN